MQVNKYIHPCQAIPINLSEESARDMLLDKKNEFNYRVKDHFHHIDNWLIERFVFGGKEHSRL